MRGRRYKGIAVALSTVTAAGTFAAAGLASGGPLRGRYYDGKPSSAGGTSLALDFQVSATGHQVKHLYLNFVTFTCPGGADAELLVPGNKTAAITPNDKFTTALPSKDSFSPNPANGSVMLSGKFGGGGTVSGKLVFTGSGPLAGCHKMIDWTGKARPLVDHFAGKVTQGSQHASISFYRTIEPHRHVTDFAVGALTLTCPGVGRRIEASRVSTRCPCTRTPSSAAMSSSSMVRPATSMASSRTPRTPTAKSLTQAVTTAAITT